MRTKFQRLNTKRGFTLIELLVYISISSIILGGVVSFTTTFFKWNIKNRIVSEVEDQGVFVMREVIHTIQESQGVDSPNPSSDDSQLFLKVADAGKDPTRFDVSSGVLRIKEGNSSSVELTNSHVTISDFVVRNLSEAETPGIVSVEFVISYVNSSDKDELNYSKKFQNSASLK
ncbi:MAG: type II secretion system GspH family protein [Candidatus Moranbacteria bacterium]|nr:type II secretion system GspH family protein [Candidatus Moranbacteria bacterium]